MICGQGKRFCFYPHRDLPEFNRVWTCGGCRRWFHTGCSGGGGDKRCDDCVSKSLPRPTKRRTGRKTK